MWIACRTRDCVKPPLKIGTLSVMPIVLPHFGSLLSWNSFGKPAGAPPKRESLQAGACE